MNKTALLGAAGATVAVLVLFYTPLAFQGGYGYYVEGPGWYWLWAFWDYYGETVNCTAPPQCYSPDGSFITNWWWYPECHVATCTLVHYISPQKLGNVFEGNCAGLAVYDYAVNDTQRVYTGPLRPLLGRRPPPECDEAKSASRRLECWPIAWIEHRWVADYPPPNATAPKVVVPSDRPTVLKFNGVWWEVETPSGDRFAVPHVKLDPRLFPNAEPKPVYGPPHVYRWLVYVPAGCRLYVPYPHAAELYPVPPR